MQLGQVDGVQNGQRPTKRGETGEFAVVTLRTRISKQGSCLPRYQPNKKNSHDSSWRRDSVVEWMGSNLQVKLKVSGCVCVYSGFACIVMASHTFTNERV
jgi:hypothetical protein